LTIDSVNAALSYQSLLLTISGTLSNNVTYTIPSGVGGQWIVTNGTTGAFNVIIASLGGGSSVILAQGYVTTIYSDGTNIVQASSSFTPGTIPSGTNMLFYQAAAPTGWTQITSENDYALRVVSGSGGGSSGSIGMSTMFSGGYNVGDTALNVGQIPAHNHSVNDPGHYHGISNLYATNANFSAGGSLTGWDQLVDPNTSRNTDSVGTGITINNTGGNGTHTHTIPALKYLDTIICQRD
jgi:hypothetical protein